MKIEKLDPNFAQKETGDDLSWYDIRNLDVEGRGWTDTQAFFDRLPARAKALVRPSVWELSRHSAGMCVRFVTDSQSISASWKVTCKEMGMPHMPASGVSGLDLYVEGKAGWRWLGAGRPGEFPSSKGCMAHVPGRKLRQYMLYLPLYNGVESVSIGIEKDATIAKARPYPASRKPIVFYGTSIVQGGCASRPGMAYTSIVARRLKMPHVNLGFSGNALMELEVATLMGELDPSVFVLDALPNMSAENVTERAEPFIGILRAARPNTPIIVLENITYQSMLPGATNTDLAQKNKNLRAALKNLKKKMKIFLVEGKNLLGNDWEGTVDGVHPTDLGFARMAAIVTAAVKRVL